MDPSPLSGPSSTNSAGQKRRWISKFKEIGLDDGSEEIAATTSHGAPLHGRSHSPDAAVLYNDVDTATDGSEIDTPRLEKSDPAIRRSNFRSMTRLHLLALILVITIPVLQNLPFAGVFGQGIIGVEGRVMERSAVQERATIDGELVSRDNSPTNVCTRWSHQSNVTLALFQRRILISLRCRYQWNGVHLRRSGIEPSSTDKRYLEYVGLYRDWAFY